MKHGYLNSDNGVVLAACFQHVLNVKQITKVFSIQPVYSCLPEDKRKIALEKIEFGKAFHAMEQELGID